MKYEDLSPGLQEKARACKTPEELLALAKEEGFELSDEQLKEVAGGIKWRCSDHSCREFSPCPLD